MTGRILSVVAAASVVVLLAGCSSHEPPPSYTEAELRALLDDRVDAAWANSGLQGVVDRPVVERAEPSSEDGGQSFAGFANCLAETGVDTWGIDEKNGGPVFRGASGGVLRPDDQLVFYRCFAEFPSPENFSNVILTQEQREYLYDFYMRWTVPCLESNGYPVTYMPTRAEYLEGTQDWLPYYLVDPGDNIIESSDIETMHARCGSPYADLDIDEPAWF